ncbi:MAG TPA: gas vesicle protein K [Bacillota bacterium]|nr:gas vesicle protein K [Bacillota bacterium]
METVQDSRNTGSRINADADNVERGLAKLVLALIELLRQLLERQAIRRIERLTDEEIERLGVTFMRLEKKMDELVEIFGLTREELNIDLGPLGNLY